MAEKKKVYLGTGRRKTSVARVRLTDGQGKIEINGWPLDNYFTEDKDRAAVMGPLAVDRAGQPPRRDRQSRRRRHHRPGRGDHARSGAGDQDDV